MKHLSKSERDEIEILHTKGYSLRAIAKVLNRSFETIRKEVKRNSVRHLYTAEKAQHKAYLRRHTCKKPMKKIRIHDELETYIREKIKDDRSPEQIAYVWSHTHPECTVSHTTIYKYVYSRYGYGLTDHLLSKRTHPHPRKHTSGKKEIIKCRHFIDTRPRIIGQRIEFGHYEVDLVMGKQGTSACLLVVIEMVTRYTIMRWLPNKTAVCVEQALKEIISMYPVRSLTFDNGSEFAGHLHLGVATYFCYPHHPREKPQVERRNKDVRRYFPKKTCFTHVSQKDVDYVMNKLNTRPMKCLHFASPSSLFSILTALAL